MSHMCDVLVCSHTQVSCDIKMFPELNETMHVPCWLYLTQPIRTPSLSWSPLLILCHIFYVLQVQVENWVLHQCQVWVLHKSQIWVPVPECVASPSSCGVIEVIFSTIWSSRGPSRWLQATSPLQELEVGGHRPAYLLLLNTCSCFKCHLTQSFVLIRLMTMSHVTFRKAFSVCCCHHPSLSNSRYWNSCNYIGLTIMLVVCIITHAWEFIFRNKYLHLISIPYFLLFHLIFI